MHMWRMRPRVSRRVSTRQAGSVRHTALAIRVQVFGRHIVLRDLSGVYFSHVRVGCIFYAVDYFGLVGLTFLDQFFDALRASLGNARQSLSVPGLAG